MIGRGLRGPKNGGKETCLIINVEDNIVQFGEQLAFKHFEHLWGDGDFSNNLKQVKNKNDFQSRKV